MDDNDINGPEAIAGYLANVQDPELQARFSETASRVLADPST